MIAFDHVTKRYDGGAIIVDDVSFTIPRGTFCAMVGASGSGKSTTLRMVNRLVEPTAGTIRFDGTDIATLKPETLRRRIGYVIQSGGLFPHWSVARNIATVPSLLGWPAARIAARVDELLAFVALPPGTGARMPHTLSGGQQQRVGLARALAADPDVLLMDEPFGALDPITRADLQTQLARIHRDTGKTIVFVTHDMDEALRLADRIAVMQDGRIAQFAPPAEILGSPANPYVRGFVGEQDLGLKQLALHTAAERARPGDAPGEPIAPETDLRAALSLMAERGVDALPVAGGRVLRLSDLTASIAVS